MPVVNDAATAVAAAVQRGDRSRRRYRICRLVHRPVGGSGRRRVRQSVVGKRMLLEEGGGVVAAAEPPRIQGDQAEVVAVEEAAAVAAAAALTAVVVWAVAVGRVLTRARMRKMLGYNLQVL